MRTTIGFRSVIGVGLVLWAGSASSSIAQSFNIDFGNGFGKPSRGYGAAADQGGVWHVSTGNSNLPERLFDIGGRETHVTFTSVDLPFGQALFNNAGTGFGDEALLDDFLDLHDSPARFAIEGLAPGSYEIFTYAWAPDDPLARTIVTVNDTDTQFVGGEWDGAHVQGVTYARHKVVIEGGERVVIDTFGLGVGTLNGIQIVQK